MNSVPDKPPTHDSRLQTPLELERLLHESAALLQGHFRLSSGLHSPNYVQCARLLEHPAIANRVGGALAAMIHDWHPQRIVSPALGGIVIGFTVASALHLPMSFTERKEGAMTLRRGFAIVANERVVVVEDVVTTGKSTRETVDVLRAQKADVIGFASILNRSSSDKPFDKPFASLMRMQLETFEGDACPLCAKGIPLDAPGSRHLR